MSRGWTATAVIREAIRRLNRSYLALPRATRRRWWTTLATGFVVVQLFALATVWLGRHLEASGALAWETAALRWYEREAPYSFNTAMWMEGVGNGFVLWMAMLFAAGVAAWFRRPLRSLAFLVGYTGVYLHIATAWTAWARQRPALIAGGIGSPGGIFHSYPSGHMVQSVFAYGLMTYLWMRAARSAGERAAAALLLALVTVFIAAGRLRVGAHWPSDVVAGVAIGGAWTAAVALALHRWEREAGAADPDNPERPAGVQARGDTGPW